MCRSIKRVGAAYRAALRPRLLVLVALAGAAAAYNALGPAPLNGLQAGALFGGFLTYKAGQLVSRRHVCLLRMRSCSRGPFDEKALFKPVRQPQWLSVQIMCAVSHLERMQLVQRLCCPSQPC